MFRPVFEHFYSRVFTMSTTFEANSPTLEPTAAVHPADLPTLPPRPSSRKKHSRVSSSPPPPSTVPPTENADEEPSLSVPTLDPSADHEEGETKQEEPEVEGDIDPPTETIAAPESTTDTPAEEGESQTSSSKKSHRKNAKPHKPLPSEKSKTPKGILKLSTEKPLPTRARTVQTVRQAAAKRVREAINTPLPSSSSSKRAKTLTPDAPKAKHVRVKSAGIRRLKPWSKVKKPKAVLAEGQKPRRWRNGTVSLREIRQMQTSVEQVIPAAQFRRLITEIAQDFLPGVRFKCNVPAMIQEVAEQWLVGKFRQSNTYAIHCRRKGITEKDFKLAQDFRDEEDFFLPATA